MHFDEDKLSFEKIRRNCLAATTLLLIYVYSGMEIKRLSFFGNEASFSDPTVVNALLYVWFFYCLVRYNQFFFDTSGSKSPSKTIKSVWYETKETYLPTYTGVDNFGDPTSDSSYNFFVKAWKYAQTGFIFTFRKHAFLTYLLPNFYAVGALLAVVARYSNN